MFVCFPDYFPSLVKFYGNVININSKGWIPDRKNDKIGRKTEHQDSKGHS